MINRVYEILKPLNIPIKWNKSPDFGINKTVLKYHFFGEGDALHGDGIDAEQGGSLQVDIFSKTDYTSTVKEVKRLLKDAGFLFDNGRDTTEDLDSNTMIYHKILIFNYIEGVVK